MLRGILNLILIAAFVMFSFYIAPVYLEITDSIITAVTPLFPSITTFDTTFFQFLPLFGVFLLILWAVNVRIGNYDG